MAYTDLTLKKLFSLAGNVCAFPGCDAPIIDTTHQVLTGQICHIKAKNKNGPRYDPSQTDEERDDYENLIVLCGAHHKIIDDEKTRDQFPVELMHSIKRSHESRSRNSTNRDDLVERIVSSLQHMLPARQPPASLTPIVETSLSRAGNDVGIDIYDFRIGLRNDGPKPIRDFRMEVEVPNAYANPSLSSVAEVRSHGRGDVKLYRRLARELGHFELYPGEIRQLALSLDFQVTFEQYRDGVSGSIAVILYSEDIEISRSKHQVAEIINSERVDFVLGSR